MAGVFEDQFTEVLVTSLKHTLIDDILHGPSILARGAEYILWRTSVPASWDLAPSSFSGLGGGVILSLAWACGLVQLVALRITQWYLKNKLLVTISHLQAPALRPFSSLL